MFDIAAMVSDFDLDSVVNTQRHVECLACGTRSPTTATTCEACQTFLVDDEVDEGLDLVAGINGVSRAQVTGRNLRRLRDALSGVATGAMSLVEYRGHVDAVYTVAAMGVLLFESDLVQQRKQTMRPRELRLTESTAALFEQYRQGVQLMQRYYQTEDFGDARDGYAAVQAAIEQLTSIQRQAQAMPA